MGSQSRVCDALPGLDSGVNSNLLVTLAPALHLTDAQDILQELGREHTPVALAL